MATKGKMELTIGVAIGSSIQIGVGLIPILVIVGWIINQDLTLFFECVLSRPPARMLRRGHQLTMCTRAQEL